MDRIKRKYVSATQASLAEYEAGVQNPKKDWADETKKAEKNYEAGVQAAIQRKSFSKGVEASGTANWKAKTLAKGPGRWAQGVALSEDDYAKGFAKYHTIIANLTLPPRGPKGDPKNIQRVAVIADALHKAKISGIA